MLNIYVRADVRHLIEGRLAPLYWILHPKVTGVLITLNGADRWLLNLPYSADAGETIDDYPPDRCIELARTAIGDPERRRRAHQRARLDDDPASCGAIPRRRCVPRR